VGLKGAGDVMLDRRLSLPQPRHFAALALDLLFTGVTVRLDVGQLFALLFQQIRLLLNFGGLLRQFAVAFFQLLGQRSGPVVVTLALALDFLATAVPEDAVGFEFARLFFQVPLAGFPPLPAPPSPPLPP